MEREWLPWLSRMFTLSIPLTIESYAAWQKYAQKNVLLVLLMRKFSHYQVLLKEKIKEISMMNRGRVMALIAAFAASWSRNTIPASRTASRQRCGLPFRSGFCSNEKLLQHLSRMQRHSNWEYHRGIIVELKLNVCRFMRLYQKSFNKRITLAS